MRCFIAMDIPNEIKESISRVIDGIRQKSNGIKWVSTQNIHMTLRFLGDIREDSLPEIERRLSSICIKHAPFSINIRGVGAFPSFKNPNVLWVGIDESAKLEGLYNDIENSMNELGFMPLFQKKGKRFSPHITIGRVRDRGAKDNATIKLTLNKLHAFKGTFFGNIEVREVLLMRSILMPTEPKYSKVASFGIYS